MSVNFIMYGYNNSTSFDTGRFGGGGVLPYIYGLYVCVVPKGMVFEQFWFEKGIDILTILVLNGFLFHSGLALDILF